jgi:hypothetical protein
MNPGEGAISEDPLFVGTSPFSFRLTGDSPCIDTGDPSGSLDPDGSLPDMGAYFFNHNGGCTYIVGDANGSNTFTGLDVTYSVRYFKGGNPPPFLCECTPGNYWYVAGDVNGSCSYSGLDVTYMVRYFKGGAAPFPCPDCPPTGR